MIIDGDSKYEFWNQKTLSRTTRICPVKNTSLKLFFKMYYPNCCDDFSQNSYLKVELRNGLTGQNYSYKYNWGNSWDCNYGSLSATSAPSQPSAPSAPSAPSLCGNWYYY